MNPILLEQIKKDKLYDYLKENSYFIKYLIRDPSFYKEFKSIIKEKYHLRFSDKVSDTIDNIELISGILSTIDF